MAGRASEEQTALLIHPSCVMGVRILKNHGIRQKCECKTFAFHSDIVHTGDDFDGVSQ
jgi:hypothetical protein